MARQYGQDSEKGQIARAVKLREMEEESLKKQKIERIASISFLVLAVIVFVGCIISSRSLKSKAASTREEISSLQQDLSELQADNADTSQTTVEVNSVASSAADAGQAACQAQNDLNAAIAAEAAAGMVDLSTEHQEALQRLRLLFLDDRSNSRAVRNTWCTFGDWEFNGVYQFEGNYITVVWKCYAKDDPGKNRLLAMVKAQYDATKDAFTRGELRYTTWYETLADDADMLTEGDQAGTNTGDGLTEPPRGQSSGGNTVNNSTVNEDLPDSAYTDTNAGDGGEEDVYDESLDGTVEGNPGY